MVAATGKFSFQNEAVCLIISTLVRRRAMFRWFQFSGLIKGKAALV